MNRYYKIGATLTAANLTHGSDGSGQVVVDQPTLPSPGLPLPDAPLSPADVPVQEDEVIVQEEDTVVFLPPEKKKTKEIIIMAGLGLGLLGAAFLGSRR